jgi:hypothetical protein
MSLKRITSKDFPLIVHWYRQRNLTPPDPRALSDTGFIADGRVAGWLYLTNSNIAMIEGIISDSKSSPGLRRESLDKLIGFMVDFALELGYTQFIGVTRHPSIEKTGKKFGFRKLPHTILYLDASFDKTEVGKG